MKLIEIFSGKKTYLVAILAGIAAFLEAMGWISQSQLVTVDMILAPLGLAFLRAGLKKTQ